MYFDNPAQNLLTFLEKGKTLDKNSNCRKAWCEVLEAETDSEAVMLSRLGKVMLLPEQTLMLLESVGKLDKDAHEHWVKRISVAFSQQDLDGVWSTFINHIDSHTISYLRILSDVLDSQKTIGSISESQLDEIRVNLLTLLDKVRESKLDGDIKRHLMRSLQRIVGAIREYSLFGVVPVIDALESAIGHAAVNETYKDNINENIPDIWETIYRIAALLSIVVGGEQLLENISGILLEKKE